MPAALVLFVPVLAFVLWLLHLRSGSLYFDDLVFSLHLQSALFGAIALSWLLARVLGASTGALVTVCLGAFRLALGVYLPLALRRVYRYGWWSTLWRSGLLLVAYFSLLVLTLGVTIAMAIERLPS